MFCADDIHLLPERLQGNLPTPLARPLPNRLEKGINV